MSMSLSARKAIEHLEEHHTLNEGILHVLLRELSSEDEAFLYERADLTRRKYYGNEIYLRGLIEFTNHCRNNCYYCGIRRGNQKLQRYRLSDEEILERTRIGYALGYRTFVLQGGEDLFFTDDKICALITKIKTAHPDCALTLSIGEKSRESYQAYFDAGADRYLLRQETSDEEHYRFLHPAELSMKHRQNCLWDLKQIGYQVGCGIMVGSPGQTDAHIMEDLCFMQELQPHMIGIGPFIPHQDTPFAKESAGTLQDTVRLLAILRLMFPSVLLPATTALGTIHPKGREMGVKAGANVIMPNLSPEEVRNMYTLYDGKINSGSEAAESRLEIVHRMEKIGYRVVVDRGDYRPNPADGNSGL